MRPVETLVEVAQKPEKTAQHWLFCYGPCAVVAFAFCATRLFRMISQYAVNIFFSDQGESSHILLEPSVDHIN